ncbi:MAG TPA: Hsp20/alpha crystallin family protein [Verrucomicrobiae bacterium]|jgi:HSP20 family protein
MTLSRWQRPDFWGLAPFRRVANLRDEMDNFLAMALGHLGEFNGENGGTQLMEGWVPAVDVFEDKDSLHVKAELAGLKKEDIQISLQDGYLTLSGERKGREKNEDGGTYRTERWEGRFHRSISLPCRVDAEKIKATYNDGVLTVTLPKAEEAKPKQIPITVK